jgi:predicted glutamine amidotransferase
MCIIAIKKSGVKLPPMDVFQNMAENNKNGNGFMYTKNGMIYIEKGFMSFDTYWRAIQDVAKEIDTTKETMVFHSRITTSGGSRPENTHPFPLTDSVERLQSLECMTNVAVAHNGTIDVDHPYDISDTMAYISTELAYIYKRIGDKIFKDKYILTAIKNRISSKLVILNSNGQYILIGDFINDKNTGMIYSNDSYEKRTPYFYNKSANNTTFYSGRDVCKRLYALPPDSTIIAKNTSTNIVGRFAQDSYVSYAVDDDGYIYELYTGYESAYRCGGYEFISYTPNWNKHTITLDYIKKNVKGVFVWIDRYF